MVELYKKHRPDNLNDIVGNTNTIESLESIFSRDQKDLPHVFLLTGPRGCGKTTIARIISIMLNCHEAEFHELDTADFRGIDTARFIKKQTNYASVHGSGNRVWLLDECHELPSLTQNALLKTLEETRENIFFILATTNPDKLLTTTKSRCTILTVNPLTEKNTIKLIKKVSKKEKKKIPLEVCIQIYENTLGHPRDVLTTLEKIIDLPKDKMLEIVEQENKIKIDAIEICRALVSKKKWKNISSILNEIKTEEPEKIRRLILSYCTSILLKQDDIKIALIMEEFIEPFYNTGFNGVVLACYRASKEIK